ncbi:unnamed protein product, partial [Symbiodinium natans]
NAVTFKVCFFARPLVSCNKVSAQATSEDDRLMIHSLIKQMPGGFDAMNSFVHNTIVLALEASHVQYENTFKRWCSSWIRARRQLFCQHFLLLQGSQAVRQIVTDWLVPELAVARQSSFEKWKQDVVEVPVMYISIATGYA